MGLADRDYMRERRTRPTRTSPFRRGGGALAIIAAITITTLSVYGLGKGVAPEIHLTGTRNGSAGRPGVAAKSPVIQPALTPPTLPTDSEAIVPQPFPASGTVQWFRMASPQDRLGTLTLGDHSGIPGDKVIRIRDAFGGPVVQVYIQDQEGARMALPIGSYSITIAAGNPWYGPQMQFGSGARYYRGGQVEVIDGESRWLMMPPGSYGDDMPQMAESDF